jgi:phage terminase large subunit-like protein
MFFVGLDLGQKQDFSAVAVVERSEREKAWLSPEFQCIRVRYLERIPLGTPYVQLVFETWVLGIIGSNWPQINTDERR